MGIRLSLIHIYTNFCRIAVGDRVNLEFDIIGKYIARISSLEA